MVGGLVMWITAWILVASAVLNQPTLPPFATQAECEAARRVYLMTRSDRAAECQPAKVFVNGQR